ncbi:unnamed protein product [Calicophoron daubneyi]|uniref:sphinganine-1-phosphate aldolase n=1 Tax=Calicophoron daubneyi TaxID=300641 RepID=A0AAV2TF55_CALDB
MEIALKSLGGASRDFLIRYYEALLGLELPAIIGTVLAVIIFVVEAARVDYRKAALNILVGLPFCGGLVRNKISQALEEIHRGVHGESRVIYEDKLPTDGLNLDMLLQKIRRYKAAEYIRWDEGFASGSVYPRKTGLAELSAKVFKEFIWANPLHPDLFPDVRKMEAEIVRMCVNLFHGDKDACGTTSSGGTESIMLACLSYRQRARDEGIQFPTMIIPDSAHPAFDKAAHYFCMDVVRVPVNPVSMKADVKAMKAAITKDTCMLVASAPGFPHGVIDPVEEIAALGLRYNIPVHVDCCLGGFLLPFMDMADFPLEPFDFRVPGVTSISCDTHKYGFAAKGTSVILYRSPEYRSKQFFTQPNWSGGVYASPTFAGSRPGALIAVCWATMMHYGLNGYIESTRRIVSTTRYIAEELNNIPGLFVYGEPEVCVVAFGSDVFNIYRLSQALAELPNGHRWSLNNLQFPPAVHLCVTDMHTADGKAEEFIDDVRTVTAELLKCPKAKAHGTAAIYGMSALIPDRSIVSEIARGFLDACYDTPSCKVAESPTSSSSQKSSHKKKKQS